MDGINILPWLILIVIFIGFVVLYTVFLPRLLITSAVKNVIKTFIKQEAVSTQNAKTTEELDIKLQNSNMLDNLLKVKDYRPDALQILLDVDIVVKTDNDHFYLVKDKLQTSKFNNLLKTGT